MLTQLQIRNLAVIDRLTLDLTSGFTVLTGETGAGKSILIDAIGLILGARADTALVRAGSDAAEVTAEFELGEDSSALAWLQAQALADADDERRCVIRRGVQAEGRTRAFVNDRSVSLTALREFGEHLVEVFGQGESQTLVRGDVQRELVDASEPDAAYRDARADVTRAAQVCHRIDADIARLREQAGRDPAQAELLRYQLGELEALGLTEAGVAALDAEHKRLANAGRLLQDGGAARDALYGGDASLYDQLTGVQASLAELARLDGGFTAAAELAAAAQAQLHDAANEIRDTLDRLDLDPERLAEVEQQVADVQTLARKHRLRAAELPAFRDRLAADLAALEGSAEALDKLTRDRERARSDYRRSADTLTALRAKAAQRLAADVTARVRTLGMPNAEFVISIDSRPSDIANVHGDDVVRFDFSANPGQPPRPLSKVASGGELSRISLALQVAVRQSAAVDTMIFDEVDAGIGGGVAEIVGAQLRALGERHQVLCVTHLAQVAAQGRQHLHIHKDVTDNQTFTRVETLDQAGRVAELARMAGGRTITRATEAHARDMLAKAGGKA